MESDRVRAVTDFSRDIAVDASAGTGKTATLIARVTNLFLSERELSPDRVLLLTFTEKTAAEMKARIVEGWERLLAACRSEASVEAAQERMAAWNTLLRIPREAYPEPGDLLARTEAMVDAVGRLSATTFHAFCRRLLLSFPAEAGVDPRFEVLAEGEAAEAWAAAFRLFLRAEFGTDAVDPRWETILGGGGEPEAVWAVVRRLCLSQRDLLAEGALDFGTPEDFLAYLRREHAPSVAWFREFVAGIADPAHEMAPVLGEALALLDRAWEAVGRGDLDAAAALAEAGERAFSFRADRTRSRKAFPPPPGSTLRKTRDALKEFWRELAEVPAGDAAARFLVERARAAAAHYAQAKGSRLDFMDLLLSARDLLARNPHVAARLSGRFRHVFVDEFQDTDPLQAEMLAAIAPESLAPPSREGGAPAARRRGRLFVVGDPKQSIYGFRRADIQVYHRFRREFVAAGGEEISLVRNFRSRPDLIDAINGLFGAVLEGREDFSPAYGPVASHRTDPGDGPPVTVYTLSAEVSEADFLCALVGRIAGTVRILDRDAGAERPASFRDIALLYRSDTGGDVVASWRRAFERAGIPHVVPSRKGFYLRQEVQDLRIVLEAADAPADPAARYAALKTIFFGLRDEEILPLFAGGTPPPRTEEALALLARLAARAGRASLTGLLAELFRETGVEFVAARLVEGERIVRNLAKAADLARAFEWRRGGSLKHFLAEIRRRAEEDREEGELPTFDEGEDAVRVSTIHAAKGLEFPVVVLANLSRGGGRGAGGLRVDRVRGLSALLFPGFRSYSAFREVPGAAGPTTFERWEREKQRAEEERLLYVAATRARDRLCFVEGGRGHGSDVGDALRGGLGRAQPGGWGSCPVTGLAGARLLFPIGASAGSGEGPGPAPAGGTGEILHVVVEEPLAPSRRPAPPPPEFAPAGPGPPEAGAAGAPGAGALPAPPLEPVSLRALFDVERGREFGEKVHRALEADPPVRPGRPGAGPPPPSVAWAEGEEARWEAIRRAIAGSALFRRLLGTFPVGTEFPLLLCRGGRSREERADLIVRAPGSGAPRGEYWVVDYKTGRREAALEGEYARQVGEYMAILASAWSAPVRGFIWYVETGEAAEVPPAN